jgi:SAM-dependent methyltransferase
VSDATPLAHLDHPDRAEELRRMIRGKSALRRWYRHAYERYAACLARTPARGIALEIGSGGGFAREVIPELVTSDVLAYDGVDRVVDATKMPFADGSLRFIGMLNVFHHIPDAAAFLREAERCLTPGGRMLIVDQHPGFIGRPILQHVHHEPFVPDAPEWCFASTGPLSGANGALTWIVFQRDRAALATVAPRLRLERYEPHSPLSYWLAGGLKSWSLLGGRTAPVADGLDRLLLGVSSNFGSFVDVELVRI